MRQIIALDVETVLLAPGNIAPKLICLSAATFDIEEGKIDTILYGNAQNDEIEEFLDDVLGDPDVFLVFHNASFDLTVIANAFPFLIPAIFSKLEAAGITDTMNREKLLNLSTHGNLKNFTAPDGSNHRIEYTLAALVLKYAGLDRRADKEGDDIWRMNYEALDNMHAKDYPPEAAKYAIQDAADTLDVYNRQAERILGEVGVGSVKTAEFHTAAGFALRLMTCWGLQVDQERVEQVQTETEAELTPEKLSILIAHGILIPAKPARPYANGAMDADGNPKMRAPTKATVSKKKLQQVVEVFSKENNVPLKITPKGQAQRDQMRQKDPKVDLTGVGVSTDGEVLDSLTPYSELIAQYQHRQKLQKLVTTYLPHLLGAKTLHPEFDPLKSTGRTSSFASKNYPSSNIQQEDPRTRPCFVARPGTVFCSVDYNCIELASLGQKCYSLFGYSVHRDKINEGVDLHAYLGAKLAWSLDTERFGLDEMTLGTGHDAMVIYEHFLEKKTSDRDYYAHWRKFAKPVGLGFPGGMGVDTFITMARNSYDITLTKETAQQMKDIWLETYPEMGEYFQWIKKECVDQNNVWTDSETGETSKLYCYLSPLGMYRAGANYCAAANGAALQTPAAEGAKGAVFNLSRACYDETVASLLYGCRPLVFNHDETITEIPDDDKTHERAWAIAHIMIDSMQRVLPDVTVRAEPVLMRRWDKKAETVLDSQGRLIVWEPKEQLV